MIKLTIIKMKPLQKGFLLLEAISALFMFITASMIISYALTSISILYKDSTLRLEALLLATKSIELLKVGKNIPINNNQFTIHHIIKPIKPLKYQTTLNQIDVTISWKSVQNTEKKLHLSTLFFLEGTSHETLSF